MWERGEIGNQFEGKWVLYEMNGNCLFKNRSWGKNEGRKNAFP